MCSVRNIVRRQCALVTCDARGQHHGEEGDKEVGVVPQAHVGLAARLLGIAVTARGRGRGRSRSRSSMEEHDESEGESLFLPETSRTARTSWGCPLRRRWRK